MADSQQEIESKFDVAPDFVVGDLTALVADGGHLQASTVDLISTYYDTCEHNLLRSRLTLRRRTGATDTGWHLKVPGDGFRTELRWSLAGNDGLPIELRRLIEPFTRGAVVGPTVQLKVIRTRYQIIDSDGALRLELADDEVRASGLSADVRAPRWREVEVELGAAGDRDDLAHASRLLIKSGAYTSVATSKLGRALNGIAPGAAQGSTAGDALLGYLRTQCDALTAGHFAISLKPYEPEAGLEPNEAVHRTRVATRRLRALLRTFSVLFEPARANQLEAELRWFAAELGEVRDREVLRSRLARAVDGLPAYLVVGPVAERIDELLLAELRQHADALLRTMRDARYRILIEDLAAWHQPPFTAEAAKPAQTLSEQVVAAEKQLAKRMKRAAGKQTADEELHSARKAGKRARYAAEAVGPALGKKAQSLVKSASRLQTLLGEHQDSLVATELLRRIADQVAEEGQNAFTYGILVADQRRSAAEAARAARETADD